MRYMEYPTSTSVNFAKTASDFSITVCSSIPVYGLIAASSSEAYVSYDTFFMQNLSFWQTWSNPRKIMDTIIIDNGTDKIDLLQDPDIKFSLLPLNNQTVAVCNTFELAPYNDIISLDVIYNKEIQVYFHNSGQLLHEWNKKENKIIVATNKNSDIVGSIYSGYQMRVYDTAVTLKMERKSSISKDTKKTYDNCVIESATQKLGKDLMECLFNRSFYNCSNKISEHSLMQLKNFLDETEECKPPRTILKISAEKSNYLTSTDFNIEDVDSSTIDITGNLGIEEKPQDEKPKIEFLLSKFTKISQVFFLIIIINSLIIKQKHFRNTIHIQLVLSLVNSEVLLVYYLA